MRLWPALACLVVLATACLAAPLSAAPAPSASITGAFRGLPAPKGERIASVRALRLETLETVAGALSRGRPYLLRVPPGTYILAGEAFDLASARTYRGLSRVSTARPGRLRLDVAMRSSARRAAAARAPARARVAASGLVVGVSPDVKIRGVPGYPAGLPIDSMIITDLSNSSRCRKVQDLRLVEIARRDEILKELALQRSRYGDPATRVTPRLLKPAYLVRGGGVRDASGNVTAELRLVELSTGKTVASATASGPGASSLDLIDSLADRLARSICNPVPSRWSGTASGTLRFKDPFSDLTETWSATFQGGRNPKKAGIYYDFTGSIVWSLKGTDIAGCNWSLGPITIPLGTPGGGFAGLYLSPQSASYQLTLSPGTQGPLQGTRTCPDPEDNGPFLRVPSLDCGPGLGKWQPGTLAIEGSHSTEGAIGARCGYRLIAGS